MSLEEQQRCDYEGLEDAGEKTILLTAMEHSEEFKEKYLSFSLPFFLRYFISFFLIFTCQTLSLNLISGFMLGRLEHIADQS